MTMDAASVPGFSDPRLPKDAKYRAFRVKDKEPGVKGVDHNDVVIFADWPISGVQAAAGMTVVTRRTIGGGRLEEFTLRALSASRSAPQGVAFDPAFDTIGPDDKIDIIGLVLTVQKPMW